MNKYFLSIISILLLFQSFKVFDEIFYHEEQEKGSKIFTEVDDTDPELAEDINDEVEVAEKFDLDSLFVNFDVKKGEKIAKQCSACHDFSVNLKV